MKRIIAIILSIVLLLGICGCAEGGGTKKPAADDTSSSQETQKDDSADKSDGTEQENSDTEDKSDGTEQENSDTDLNASDKKENGEEITRLSAVEVPGEENWSNDPDAYTLTVSNESIGKFKYFGWFVTDSMVDDYQQMTPSQREQYLKYMLEDQNCNYVALSVNNRLYYQSRETGFDIGHVKDALHVGKGGLVDELAKRRIPVFILPQTVPLWMRGESPNWVKSEYMDDFARMTANFAYDLVNECGLNVVNIALSDEPDGITGGTNTKFVNHFFEVVPKLKEYLKKYGLGDIGIIGPETCVLRSQWLNVLRSDSKTWDNMFAFSGHIFNHRSISIDTLGMTRVTNKPLYATSVGTLNTYEPAANYFTVNKAGQETVADYVSAAENLVILLNGVNYGVNQMTFWSPSVNVSDITYFDGCGTGFYHIFYNQDGSVFENHFATSANHDYFSQALNTVEPGATIYQCSNDKEGVMEGDFKCTMNASAGMNPDGTWGINIFNKTDSTVCNDYLDMEWSPKPQPAKTIVVNFDIKGLYGTGQQQFEMYTTNTSGSAREKIGTITIVDGRGTTEVYPWEMISLRSVNAIKLNNKPNNIQEELKDLTVGFEGNDYIYKNGKKQKLSEEIQLKYYDDYANSGILFNIKDFATIIEAKYEVIGDEILISNDIGMLRFSKGSKLVKYSGAINGTFSLPQNVTVKNGNYYFDLADTNASIISEIFGIDYKQYTSTGLFVIGETEVENLGRFSKLFQN